MQCFYGCWLLHASKRDDPKLQEKRLILLRPVFWKTAGQNIMMGNLADMLVNRQGNTRHGQLLDTWWQRWCWRTLHTWGWFLWKRTGKWSLCSGDHLLGLARGAWYRKRKEKKRIGKEHGRWECGVSLQHHSLAFVLVGLIGLLVLCTIVSAKTMPCFSNKRCILLCFKSFWMASSKCRNRFILACDTSNGTRFVLIADQGLEKVPWNTDFWIQIWCILTVQNSFFFF